MTSKTISIDPQHFKLGNSKKKSVTVKNGISTTSSGTKINIHNSNIRELLLSKLQQHREKTQKKIFHTTNPPIQHKIQMNNFDEPTHSLNNELPLNISNNITNVTENKVDNTVDKNTITNLIHPDKPYGVLKNGVKPTYKIWNQTHKNYDESIKNDMTHNKVSNIELNETMNNAESKHNLDNLNNLEINNEQTSPPTQMIQEKEIKKNYKLGLNKKNKTISILIKNSNTRKKIETDKTTYKKTPITTVKNYLKKKNFIRFGATAPTQLMRDMYENLKLCGDVINENPKLLVENLKDTNQ